MLTKDRLKMCEPKWTTLNYRKQHVLKVRKVSLQNIEYTWHLNNTTRNTNDTL